MDNERNEILLTIKREIDSIDSNIDSMTEYEKIEAIKTLKDISNSIGLLESVEDQIDMEM